MIEAHALSKSFGLFRAVDSVDLVAHNGAITGLLGGNGAGKTSTFRMILGLSKPDTGTVRIDGIDPFLDPERARRSLGVLSDARGLYAKLTTREHIVYFGELHGMSLGAIDARIRELDAIFQMSSILDREVSGFSQGERVKVALARTLVHDPPNVILDEPTNGLDIWGVRAVRELLAKLRELGKCVVFSSHVMPEVEALCDSVVVLSKGRVLGRGTSQEIKERTRTNSIEEAFVSLVEGQSP